MCVHDRIRAYVSTGGSRVHGLVQDGLPGAGGFTDNGMRLVYMRLLCDII